MIIDKINKDNLQGIVEFYIKRGNQEPVLESKHNIVVSNARKILRDLVYGKFVKPLPDVQEGEEQPEPEEKEPAPTIQFLVLGDMNMDLAEAYNGTPEATVNDKTLIHPTVWVPVNDPVNYPDNKVEALMYKGLNSIKYTFVIDKSEGNSSSGFFNELGLAISPTDNPDSYLFTKLNRGPLVKTGDDQLIIQYYLLF